MIRFDGVSKAYGRRQAVARTSLTVGAGEVVALLGPNGSGKSTLLKAAAGLVRPSEGRVLLGDPGTTASDPAARRSVSYLPQDVAFPHDLTGREVVELFRRLRSAERDDADAALRASALGEAADRPVGTYSGGMTQRLGLAVAALARASALLLDEPTASLDAEGLSVFYDLVEEHRRRGLTVLFTSHGYGDVERLADRVVVLVEGRLVGDLTQAALTARLAETGARLDHLYRDLARSIA